MFNAEFFPTPEAVIRQMLAPWLGGPVGPRGHHTGRAHLAGLTILEPSAGGGAILDFIVAEIERVERGDYGRRKSRNLYACEADPELKALLHGKDYKVLADDFLGYHGDHQFDLVVLNPPFSCGDKHVLHAYQTVAPGGHVVALVNSETLRNPFTETRQLLAKLLADHGSSEELGPVFREAERPTDVAVSLIRLQKPAGSDPLHFEFQRRSREHGPRFSEETYQDKVAVRDAVGNMMLAYQEAKEAFVSYLEARQRLQFFGSSLVGLHEDILKLAEEAIGGNQNPRATYNDFSDALKQSAWREVLGKLNIQKYLTCDVRRDFDTYGRQHGYLDFTQEAVAELITLIFENRTTIMQRAIEAVFDIFTEYHAENRCYVEGWKTNSKYKVNLKIILPRWVRWDDWDRPEDLRRYGSQFKTNWSFRSDYGDIDKVMCYLTGRNYDSCLTVERALDAHFQRLGKVYPGESFADALESEFFYLRFFKKGTLHLTFKDPRLHQEFNLRACAGKNWLPEPEMQAYQRRKRSPFDPEPEPAPASAPVVRQLPGVGAQASLFPLAQAA